MLSLTHFGWLSLLLAVLMNLVIAWRIGRTACSRWLIASLYTAVLGGIFVVVLLALIGASRLVSSLNLQLAREWLPLGLGGFWILVVAGVWLRLRRYNE